jgi:hypothetical protein
MEASKDVREPPTIHEQSMQRMESLSGGVDDDVFSVAENRMGSDFVNPE